MAWSYYSPIIRIEIDYAELADYFRRILYKRDFLVVVVGRKGSGKSMTAASLGMEIDPNFTAEDMVWNMDQFYKRLETKINSDKKFGCMVLDDFGGETDAYDFLSNAAKSINHLMQKSRTFHQGFFLTVPDPKFINKNLRERLPDYRIEVIGHNSRERYSVIKLLKLNTNLRTGFTLYNHLFSYTDGDISSNWKEGQGKAIQYCIPAPPQSFFDWYIPFRDQLAKEQLQTSIKRLHGGSVKNKILSAVEAVKAEPDKYVKAYNKTQKCWNKDLIELSFDLKPGEARKVAAMLGDPALSNPPPLS
jgi:ABC-type dipeptide/oligopeptide/nickel transport system ATPase component